MRNRDVDDMYISILQVLRERENATGRRGRGIPYTQLLGIVGAGLDYGNIYVSKMEELKLIEINKDGMRAGRNEIRRCSITEKGIDTLKLLEERQKMLGIDFAR